MNIENNTSIMKLFEQQREKDHLIPSKNYQNMSCPFEIYKLQGKRRGHLPMLIYFKLVMMI